jgi:hypothetical protein
VFVLPKLIAWSGPLRGPVWSPAMIHIDFTPEQIDALHHERFHHPHPRVQQKIEAVYLKSQGLLHQDICTAPLKSDHLSGGSFVRPITAIAAC